MFPNNELKPLLAGSFELEVEIAFLGAVWLRGTTPVVWGILPEALAERQEAACSCFPVPVMPTLLAPGPWRMTLDRLSPLPDSALLATAEVDVSVVTGGLTRPPKDIGLELADLGVGVLASPCPRERLANPSSHPLPLALVAADLVEGRPGKESRLEFLLDCCSCCCCCCCCWRIAICCCWLTNYSSRTKTNPCQLSHRVPNQSKPSWYETHTSRQPSLLFPRRTEPQQTQLHLGQSSHPGQDLVHGDPIQEGEALSLDDLAVQRVEGGLEGCLGRGGRGCGRAGVRLLWEVGGKTGSMRVEVRVGETEVGVGLVRHLSRSF